MNSEHRRHDRLLVARFAADDSYPGEIESAKALVASCTECAALVGDIRLLSTAVAAIPTPRRPRDFRLTAEQADRLRGSWLERLMRRLAAPSSAMLRPVAGVAMSIGLVLAVVGAMPAGLSAGAPLQDAESTQEVFAAAPSEMPQPEGTASVNAPQATDIQAAPPIEGFPTMDMTASGDGRSLQGEDSNAANASPEPLTDTLDNAYLYAGGEADVGSAGSNASTQQFTVSREMLFYTGVLIGAFALAFLVLIVYARRRYADPYLG